MEEEERHSDLFLEFAFRNDGLKKKKANDSQSSGAVFLPSIHPVKKVNARSNLPMIDLQSQNSRGISPYFQKKKTLECNSNRIISPYFQKAVKEEEDRDSEAPLESESRGISPYFQKKRRMVSDSIAYSGSDSNSQRLISPYFQKAVKQEERYSEEHCNIPNETDNKKKKKKRKRKGNDTFESLKEERKINVQNVKMDDQKMGVELPVFNSNSSSQRKVSPFCQKAAKEEEEMNLEAQVDSKPTVVSPYFEKKKRAVSDSVANSSSNSNSQRLLSPYFQKAVKQQERNPEEHCNFPNKIERRKTKKRKRKGNDTVESFKEQEKKINVQNVRVEDQKMEVQQPISSSNSNSQMKVSPYCQRAVKEEEEGNSEEETKKGHENEESFKEGKRKTNAQNVTMEDEKMKLPKKKRRAPPIRIVSPYFPINEEDAKKPVRAMFFNKLNVAYRRKTPDNNWKPPPSRFHLLQEDHYHDPWRVMVICMLLNCTTGLQASRVISDLFTLCPDAKTATEVPTGMIEKVIETLGLQKKRAVMIQRFSREYLDDSWTHVTQLHGIGKYAADAYAIFCSGDWGLVVPNDHMLVKYWKHLFKVIAPSGSQKQ
ncbi:hypothetical protein PVL29_022827 [Vitis rotundifolia]|uniref:Methyl-CpG-binding domain protein 4-like protein n=1 Tax=Vitis rotundifolia TaxID=103349 RepID=A0AA38YX04_VITRO|nr:hypothetical protein PVL29_022827 [Vitis rotundifolia]